MLDDASGDAIRLPILCADDGSLSDWASTRMELLSLVLIALFPTDVGFVHFDRSCEGVAGWRGPRFADAMQHEPGCRLRHTNIAVELHTRNAL